MGNKDFHAGFDSKGWLVKHAGDFFFLVPLTVLDLLFGGRRDGVDFICGDDFAAAGVVVTERELPAC